VSPGYTRKIVFELMLLLQQFLLAVTLGINLKNHQLCIDEADGNGRTRLCYSFTRAAVDG